MWVDYVADTGDGFDGTFATACCLAGPPGLVVSAGADDPVPAAFEGRPSQADLLVLGGDQVYPVASASAYEERLNEVLRVAGQLAGVAHSPPVVALPGNHDWYDGLAAFRRNFCESWVLRGHQYLPPLAPETTDVPPAKDRDDVGGWGAFQSRSYFAVQLSARWWLWALDSQLDAPIDAEQLAYFHDARRLLGDADVILCTASPSWLEAGGSKVYAAMADTPFYTLLWFIDRVLGEDRSRIRLVLTGDQHHYNRYSPVLDHARPAPEDPVAGNPAAEEPPEPAAPQFAPELVTCGGGGAFLASTHHLPERLTPAWQPWPTGSGLNTAYDLTTAYPTPAQSKSLVAAPRFLAAAWRNGWSLPLLVGAVDVVLVLGRLLDQRWLFGLTAVTVAILLGVYAASGAKERRPKWRKRLAIGSLLLGHTAGHVGVALLVAAVVGWLASVPNPFTYAVAFALSMLLGMFVFVTYLHVADWFGCHTLEAFSALRFTDYKSHLRLQISADHVHVHVIGMDSVPQARQARDLRDVLPRPYVLESFSVAARPRPVVPAATSGRPATTAV